MELSKQFQNKKRIIFSKKLAKDCRGDCKTNYWRDYWKNPRRKKVSANNHDKDIPDTGIRERYGTCSKRTRSDLMFVQCLLRAE